MANTKRRLLQRKAYQALNDTERVLEKIQAITVEFEPVHPEYMPLLVGIVQAQMVVQSLICAFFKHAWGRAPNPTRWQK
jgi:hypothetical protein